MPPARELAMVTPTPREAARRLSKFTNDVKLKLQSPLIKSPPKQKPPVQRQLLPLRSSRIAAQKMDHIPASKRGEVLLMRRMGVMPPAAPPSSAAKHSNKAYFQGPLAPDQVEALDALFPAASNRAGGATRRPIATAA